MMKKHSIIVLLFTLFISLSGRAETLTTPLSYLKAMVKAHQTQNYELLYILQKGEETESFRYRHAYWQNQEYAQLLKLDLVREEMILRDGAVGYFGDFQPFSLRSSHIFDHLPSVIYTAFDSLSHYDFIDGGRSRMADRVARVIRIVPRDDFRYQYILWIDEEHHLLLKSELLDRDGNPLEQFRVIQSLVDDDFNVIVEPIRSLVLPPLMTINGNSPSLTWQAKWIPAGFESQQSGRQRLSNLPNEELMESRFYSDGLFSFTLYQLQNRGISLPEQFWKEGKISLYSQTIGDKDIIVIGEIPLVSARHIVQSMGQNLPLVEEKSE